MALGTEVDLGPGNFVLDADPAARRPQGGHSPLFSAHVYCSQTVADLNYR